MLIERRKARGCELPLTSSGMKGALECSALRGILEHALYRWGTISKKGADTGTAVDERTSLQIRRVYTPRRRGLRGGTDPDNKQWFAPRESGPHTKADGRLESFRIVMQADGEFPRVAG